MNNQQLQVLNMIKGDGNITRLHAAHMGIQNVTARIAELRKLGYKIEAVPKQDMHGRSYSSWTLQSDLMAYTDPQTEQYHGYGVALGIPSPFMPV
jgi:hypothetical protein